MWNGQVFLFAGVYTCLLFCSYHVVSLVVVFLILACPFQREKMAKRDADRSIAPTYFLWNAFVPNRYYYEVNEKGRASGGVIELVEHVRGSVYTRLQTEKNSVRCASAFSATCIQPQDALSAGARCDSVPLVASSCV